MLTKTGVEKLEELKTISTRTNSGAKPSQQYDLNREAGVKKINFRFFKKQDGTHVLIIIKYIKETLYKRENKINKKFLQL